MKASLIRSLLLALIATSVGTTHAVFAAQTTNELREINQLSEQGNQAAALERVNSYLASHPKNAEAMFMRGVILAEMGKRDDAVRTFIEVSEKYPELPEPYNNLAVIYADQGQYDKAKKALESAIKTHPSYATAHENLGDIYARLASEAYDKALKLDTTNARAQNKLAMITELFNGSKKTVIQAAVTPAVTPKVIVPTPTLVTPTLPVQPTQTAKKAESQSDVKLAPKVQTKSEIQIKPEMQTKPETKPELKLTNEQEENAAQEKLVQEAVQTWSRSWADKNVERYLGFYSKAFKTPNNEARKAWEQQRRDRINKPGKISVTLKNVMVRMDGAAAATVYFRQSYQATGLDASSNKTLNMVKEGGHWLIIQERIGHY